MSGEMMTKDIIFDLIARHGLVVIALGFLGWLILTQNEAQRQEMEHWRAATAQITQYNREEVAKFIIQLKNVEEALHRAELVCLDKVPKKD